MKENPSQQDHRDPIYDKHDRVLSPLAQRLSELGLESKDFHVLSCLSSRVLELIDPEYPKDS